MKNLRRLQTRENVSDKLRSFTNESMTTKYVKVFRNYINRSNRGISIFTVKLNVCLVLRSVF